MAFLRRIRSPREREDPPASRSFNTSSLSQRFGHRRHRSDETAHVVVHSSEPSNNCVDDYPPPFAPGLSLDDYGGDNPPLPPRNRPASVGNPNQLGRTQSVEDDPYYITPLDTIRRGPANLALPSGAAPTRSEKRQMELHQRTLSQRQDVSPGEIPPPQHRRTGSFGRVVDSSEYSIPWDLMQQQRHHSSHEHQRHREHHLHHSSSASSIKTSRSSEGGAPKKPPKYWSGDPARRSQIRASQPTHDSSDDIILVTGSIPSDESSRTSSPGTPPATVVSGPSLPREGDYDEPWDKKFPNFNMPSMKNRGRLEDDQPRHGSVGSAVGRSYIQSHSHHHHSHSDLHPPPSHQPPPPPLDRDSPPLNAQPSCLSRFSPPIDDFGPRGLNGRSYSNRDRTHYSPPLDDSRRWNSRPGSERVMRETSPIFHSSSLSQPEVSPRLNSSVGLMHTREAPKHYPMPSTESKPRSGSSVTVPIKNRQLPSPPPPEYASVFIDPSVPLEHQLFYHGAITRYEAEGILANEKDFSFLVRNSESCRTDYSLSIRDQSCGFIHLRIVYEKGGYVLGQFSSTFNTVQECIAFYTRQRLNIRGAEHKRLQHPVARMP